nr:zinc finger BED domain-containing protein RICESLEEPER 2 [Tanacetum cinerariifolium]
MISSYIGITPLSISCGLQALSDSNYLFGGFMYYLWSRELNISNFGPADRKILPVDSCMIKSPKLTKSDNQLRFLIHRVPSGCTSNVLSIPRRFSASMFSYLIALVWASRIYDDMLKNFMIFIVGFVVVFVINYRVIFIVGFVERYSKVKFIVVKRTYRGFTGEHDSVQRVTKTVRYIKNSTQRINKFKKCIEDSDITTKQLLVSDCATRWNSTFDMLKVANELNDAFYKYDIRNSEYRSDLEKVPEAFDFRICVGFVEFLEKFKVKTKNMSASTKPLSHLFFSKILDIDTHLRKWQAKPAFKVMATKMRSKYKKYWGKLSEINDFMYFAILLDPTMKSQLVSHRFRKIIRYDITPENPMSNNDLEQMVSNMVDEVVERMGVLFEIYKERCGFDSSSPGMCESLEPEATSPSHGDNDFLNDYYKGNDTSSIESETELQRYLKEPKVELRKGQIFNILQWWKVNGPRFPIVARMPKDSLEDLFNDDEIVKDMEYELKKTSENDKGEQNVE